MKYPAEKTIDFQIFAKLFSENGCNWTKTAYDLGVSRPTLLRKFKGKFEIKITKKKGL